MKFTTPILLTEVYDCYCIKIAGASLSIVNCAPVSKHGPSISIPPVLIFLESP